MDPEITKKSPEAVTGKPRLGNAEQQSSAKAEGIRQAGSVAYAETVGVDVEAVGTMGNVAEVLSEGGEAAPGTGIGGKQASDDKGVKAKDPVSTAQIKARLLKNLPSERLMRKQIEKEIRKEIKGLHRRAMKLARSSGGDKYFEMANIVRKMRELKDILSVLVKSSVEALKAMWLKFVHGVM